LIASFSRALSEGLTAGQSDEKFNAMLADSIDKIYQASITLNQDGYSGNITLASVEGFQSKHPACGGVNDNTGTRSNPVNACLLFKFSSRMLWRPSGQSRQ
jgi:hypothetical protein